MQPHPIGSGGGGAATFVDLTDTPGSITAVAFVLGNAGGTALIQSAILTGDANSVFATRAGITTDEGTAALGLSIDNSTDSTVGVPIQRSPSLRFRSHIWDSGGSPGSVDEKIDWFIQADGASSSYPIGYLRFASSSNDGANVDNLVIDDNGEIEFRTLLKHATSGLEVRLNGIVIPDSASSFLLITMGSRSIRGVVNATSFWYTGKTTPGFCYTSGWQIASANTNTTNFVALRNDDLDQSEADGGSPAAMILWDKDNGGGVNSGKILSVAGTTTDWSSNTADSVNVWLDGVGCGTDTGASALQLESVNDKPAAAGAQQNSGSFRQRGAGWRTDATAESQRVDFYQQVRPIQGTASPTASWFLSSDIDEAGITDVLEVSDTGDVTVTNDLTVDGELSHYGEISAYENSTGSGAFSGTGMGNMQQVLIFDTDGLSRGTTPDHTNDHITIDKAGRYLVTCTISFSGTANHEIGLGVHKNNGVTHITNLHTHRKLGSGGDIGACSVMGIVALSATDTVELWAWNETGTAEIVIEDVTLTVVRVGA